MTRSNQGWRLTIILIALVGIAAFAIFLSIGGIDGVRATIRLTARTSFALFLAAFTASALSKLLPSPFTHWLRTNRRYLGVAFAGSHFIHLGFIIAFARMDPALFYEGRTPASFIGPGITYLFIAAMAATSFDRTARAIGPRAWRWLHLIGVYSIWISFAVAFGSRALKSGFYVPFIALAMLALILRISARFIRKPRPELSATE